MDYESVGLLHEQFVRSAERTPDKLAVVSPEENLKATFRELELWTKTLATTLQSMGVKAQSSVAIFLEKGMDFVVSYIAILRAGGGYLPIDTSYPEHLLASVLEDSQPTVVITCPELVARLQTYPSDKVIVLKETWQDMMAKENTEKGLELKAIPLTLDSLAYTVYSSGTTGKPKGIMCPHRGAVFSYYHRHETYPYCEGGDQPHQSEKDLKRSQPYNGEEREGVNIFFVWEMLRPLLRNVTLYVITNHTIYDPPRLCTYLQVNKITRILVTPSLLETIINTQSADRLKESFNSLRQVWFCGEVVTTSLLERCVKLLPWVRFINLYSVSECHDVACEDLTHYYRNFEESLMSRKFCPVGHILEGVKIIILDNEGNQQPVGMSGEIYVGGPTLAIGYVNRPKVQSERFIYRKNSAGEEIRLYRTGDWGYMLSDGSLEICGRVDSMVKIRGYSIEVQAIEACLLSLPMVKACVVIVCGEEGQDKFLVTYIVSSQETSKKEVRAELKKRLPFYMIPSYFVFLKSIPVLAASGKLDKKALPAFDSQLMDGVGAEGRPSTVTEVALAEMWIDVLRLKEIDIQESFFDLGGHSLLATELLERARNKFQIDLAVRDLFKFPTVASLATLIDSRLDNTRSRSPPVQTPQLDLHAEVKRHDQGVTNLDMQLRAFWRTFQYGHHFNRGRVLLTGATGFLGAFVLRELLLHTKLVVYCLAREQPGVDMIDRIKTTLAQFGILAANEGENTQEQAMILEGLSTRTTVLKGNVALMHLGLDEADYTYMCTDVDFVIHAAAAVNLVYPYSALHGSNVMGTANVIQFASTGKVKALHYVSTDAIFPHGLRDCQENADVTQFPASLEDGYSQSKWVAEQLVSRARDRGLPVTIYRLGNMSGDSKQAFWNPQDFTLLMLQACSKTGLAPSLDWDMEMTPVDFAAQVIVKLTQNPNIALSKTLHIINDRPMKSRQVFQWMNNHGYPLHLMDFKDWKTKVVEELNANNGSGQPSAKLIEQVIESYAGDEQFLPNLSSYNTSNMQRVLGELGLLYPYTDEILLQTYFTKLSARGLLNPKRIGKGPLSGRVALVTGASSGIGRATAIALASAGAKVSLAARRADLLQEAVKAIKNDKGEAMSMEADVTSMEQMKAIAEATESTLGPVDILVNCAGVMYYTLMKNVHQQEWDRQIDVNCKGITNSIGAVLGGMIKRGKGHIVNISSDAGRKGFAGLAVYSGTKFFVEGMSQALRLEVASTGVKVTCIQPGDVNTPLQNISTDEEANQLYNGSGNTQILEAEDVARAIVYAVSQPNYVAINEILVQPREAPI
ncbi:hypothetical protein EGW08_013895 [Elysia chlorotica]|uniref:Fatty acid synthase n=1 Tax=Elysia chlorotica TaxID=188477 RepID=A0A3S1BYN6_ELYCH|nr:hypothetical protein EGW08_013895 [Elysia chlorotica]